MNRVLELSEFFDRPVRTLSLGQRMRADLGAALLHNPKVLYLDEPTIGLDLVVKDNIRVQCGSGCIQKAVVGYL